LKRWLTPPQLPLADWEQASEQPVTMQAMAISLNQWRIHCEPQLPLADWEQPATMQALAISLNRIHRQPQLPLADWEQASEQPVTMSLSHLQQQLLQLNSNSTNAVTNHWLPIGKWVNIYCRMREAAIPMASRQFSK